MSSRLTQNPWTFPPNYYFRTDGTVVYLRWESHFWFNVSAAGLIPWRNEESVECQVGQVVKEHDLGMEVGE
jgi:hypothetical protein